MKKILAIAFSALVFTACKKEHDNKNSSADGNDYTSVRQFDVNGIDLGSLNNTDDDYRQENWPDWVLQKFAPLDTVDLRGFYPSEVTIDRLFPNPCKDTQTLKYFATQPINLKLLLIDEGRNTLMLQTYSLNNAQNFLGLSYKNLALAPGNYRLFFGLSANNYPFYKRGHIDILVNQ